MENTIKFRMLEIKKDVKATDNKNNIIETEQQIY